MPDGTRIIVRGGTPQGGPLSPLLSNIVLDELDQELARLATGSCAMPTTVTCSLVAPGPVCASWPPSPSSWPAACGSGSTGRRVPCATRAMCTSWGSASAAAGRPDRRPAVGKDGTTASGDHQGADSGDCGQTFRLKPDSDSDRCRTAFRRSRTAAPIDGFKGSLGSFLVKGGAFRSALAQALALEGKAVRAVHETVEDGVGDRRVGDDLVPVDRPAAGW